MKRKNKPIVIISLCLIFISLIGALSIFGAYAMVKSDLNYDRDEELFASVQGGGVTKFYYDASYGNGEYLPKELCVYKGSGVKKQWVSYDKIGEPLKKAFISAEDRSFFEHGGVDLKRTGFAVLNYFFHIKQKFGGSTITQQVIKNISGDNEQTITRKLSEIFRAIHLESRHTKEDILEVYMNIVPMGDGIMGVGMASDYYFGKSPDELSNAEAATLAGITNAPSRYNPRINPDKSLNKRNVILYAMLECGEISEQEYQEAISSELKIVDLQHEEISSDSWFVEAVCDDLARDISKQKGISESAARIIIARGGLSVYTTVNPEIQSILEEYFEEESNFPDSVKNGLDYSMVITDSKNGNLLGIVGSVGKKCGNRLLNNAAVPHTPGSALKPIALYAPLINEKRINWATVFDDVPVYFNENSSGEYTPYPKNYPNVYDGLINVSNALMLSKNTVAVRLSELCGKEKIFNSLKQDFGFDLIESEKTKSGGMVTDKALSPLALGQLTRGVSLRDLTQSYTVFPNEGKIAFCRSYTKAFDSQGKLVVENTAKEKRVYSKECARIMNQMLMKVTEDGTAKIITLGNLVDTAGKTGTSGGDLDRLFIGYTPYYTAGIWCGYSKERISIGAQSISHLEIWDRVMNEIHQVRLKSDESVEGFSVDGLEFLPYCKDSGERFSENCLFDPRESRLEYGFFTRDNKPDKFCKCHVVCLYDEVTGAVATKGCPKENLVKISLLDISERSFPMDIIVTDAEFVWRRVSESDRLGDSYDIPYFIYTVDEGVFVGRGKRKKQYNSSCYIHDG